MLRQGTPPERGVERSRYAEQRHPGFPRCSLHGRVVNSGGLEQVHAVIAATRILSYRVFFFVLYSQGLRISEGLALTVADIDTERGRVHIRDSKGNRDRFVPLPRLRAI